MYVCVCNAVTDRQIRAQSECTRGTVAEIYRALGIKVKCGKCVRTAKCIIAEMQPEACSEVRDGLSLPAFAIPAFAIPAFATTDNRADMPPSENRAASAIPTFATAD
jgi:bacterioferritin-associated ferredoxin